MTRLDDTIESLRTKATELDVSSDALSAGIRDLSRRLAATHATTVVWLATPITETDPDMPGAKMAWMVGYSFVRRTKDKDQPTTDGRVWCLCAKRLKVDIHGNALEVIRTCALDSAPRHVRAAAVSVLPKLIKEIYNTVELHTASVVRAAEAMKAFNAGKEA